MAIFGVKEEWVTEQLQILNSRLMDVAKRNQEDLKLFTESYLQLEAKLKQENALLSVQIQALSDMVTQKEQLLKEIISSLNELTTDVINIDKRINDRKLNRAARQEEEQEDEENVFDEDDLDEDNEDDSPREDKGDKDEDVEDIGGLKVTKYNQKKALQNARCFCTNCKKNVSLKVSEIRRRLNRKYAIGKCEKCGKDLRALIP
jgi:hypothetical protein